MTPVLDRDPREVLGGQYLQLLAGDLDLHRAVHGLGQARFRRRLEDWGEPPPGLPAIRERMADSTRFLLGLLKSRPELVRPPEGERPRVAYHDSCQTKRQLGLVAEPRRVLELAGYEVVDLVEVANCCGFGGTFSMDWPEVADRMVEWKLEAVAATGCGVLRSRASPTATLPDWVGSS